MTAATLPDTPAPRRSDATRLVIHRWLVVTVGLSSSLALSLSGTITNVAVPDIMGAFGVGQDQAQWMATAFFAAMTAAMLISDWLTRSFGMPHRLRVHDDRFRGRLHRRRDCAEL